MEANKKPQSRQENKPHTGTHQSAVSPIKQGHGSGQFQPPGSRQSSIGITKPNTGGSAATPMTIHHSIRSPGQISLDAQRTINTAIGDYFMKLGLVSTFHTFQQEMQLFYQERGAYPLKENLSIIQLLKAFDQGSQDQFFERWGLCMNLIFRGQKHPITYNMEFYLHVYFTIYPIHPAFRSKYLNREAAQSDYMSRIQNFIRYLETLKNARFQTQEVLGYFALPYLSNPENWIVELRERVIAYLHHYLGSGLQIPLIFQFYESYKQSRLSAGIHHPQQSSSVSSDRQNSFPQPSDSQLQKELNDLRIAHNQLQDRYSNLQQTLLEHDSKWTNFASNILKQAQGLYHLVAQPQHLSREYLLSIQDKLQRYRSNIQKYMEGGPTSLPRHDPSPIMMAQSPLPNRPLMTAAGRGDGFSVDYSRIQNDRDISVDESTSPIGGYPGVNGSFDDEQLQSQQAAYLFALAPLDYNKIRTFLSEKADPEAGESAAEDLENKKCMVLKALRLRLIQMSGGHEFVRWAYIHYNVLGMSAPKDETVYLLLSSSRGVMGHCMSLLNAIANDSSGRSYILQHFQQRLVRRIVQIYDNEKGDTTIRQNSIGLLQKLSLRPECQIELIQNNMIQLVAKVLQEESDTLSDYSLEYTTAMLMNLTLRSKGKIKCEEIELNIIKILSELMQNDNLQVRSYVNGTLYSILTRSKLQERAKEIDLEHMLIALMDHSQEQFKKQIEYLLVQLQNPPNDDSKSDQEDFDDDGNEDDEFDPEIQERITEEEHKQAQDLLMNEFYAPEEVASYQREKISKIIQDRRQRRNASINESAMMGDDMIVGGGNLMAGRVSSGGLHNNSVLIGTNSEKPVIRPATPVIKPPSVPPDQPDRSGLASELRSRPKIPRTPVKGSKPQNQQKPQPSSFEEKVAESPPIPTAKKEPSLPQEEVPLEAKGFQEEKNSPKKKDPMTETQMQSFNEAFTRRDKILRTPPGGAPRFVQNQQAASNQFYKVNPANSHLPRVNQKYR